MPDNCTDRTDGAGRSSGASRVRRADDTLGHGGPGGVVLAGGAV